MQELFDLLLHSTPHRLIAFMFLITVAATVLIAILERWVRHKKREDSDLLMLKARREDKSEYEIFVEAASVWRLSEKQIEEDFKQYLQQGIVPHYVRHAIRNDESSDNES